MIPKEECRCRLREQKEIVKDRYYRLAALLGEPRNDQEKFGLTIIAQSELATSSLEKMMTRAAKKIADDLINTIELGK